MKTEATLVTLFSSPLLGLRKYEKLATSHNTQQSISEHLPKMPGLVNPVNADLSRGFPVRQVAEKHGWIEPMAWSVALEDKDDLERFKQLRWGLRTWDLRS